MAPENSALPLRTTDRRTGLPSDVAVGGHSSRAPAPLTPREPGRFPPQPPEGTPQTRIPSPGWRCAFRYAGHLRERITPGQGELRIHRVLPKVLSLPQDCVFIHRSCTGISTTAPRQVWSRRRRHTCSHTTHIPGTGGPYDPPVPLLAPADADLAASPTLGQRDRAVLAVLLRRHGRVVDRSSLRREAGLAELSPRRCEAVLVRLRAVLGDDAIVTVRRRGWMLRTDASADAARPPRSARG